MVTRSEQIFYGVIGIVCLTMYQFLIEPWLMSRLGEGTGFAERLGFNLLVWALSTAVVFLLIRQIKRKATESGEGA